MTRMTGTFKVLGWEEQPYDAPDLPALTHALVSQELLGDIEGEASVVQGISGEGYFDTTHDSATYTLEVSL